MVLIATRQAMKTTEIITMYSMAVGPSSSAKKRLILPSICDIVVVLWGRIFVSLYFHGDALGLIWGVGFRRLEAIDAINDSIKALGKVMPVIVLAKSNRVDGFPVA